MEKPIEKENLSKIALQGSAYNLFSLVILKFGGLIFTIILARMLLPELFGIYSLALSIVTIAVVFTDLGVDNSFARYLSDSLGQKKKGLSRSYLRYFLRIKFFLLFAVIVVLLTFSKYLAYNIYEKPILFYPLVFSCLFIFSESLRNFILQVFPSKKDFKMPVFFDTSSQVLKIVFTVFAILIFTDSLKVSGIFIAFFLASLVTFILEFFIVVKKDREIIFGRSIKFDKSRVNNYWKYMILASVSLAFFGSIDMLMLGKFVASEYLAYYRVSMSLILTIASLFSLSGILLPIFTQIHGKRFGRGFHKAMKYILILSIPAVAGAIFLGKYLIKVVYGNEYLLGSTVLYFLVPLIITAPLVGLYSMIFKSKEKSKVLSNAILISLIVNIALNGVSIVLFRESPIYLISAVGLSTALSRISLLGVLVLSARKQFNFKVRGLGTKKPIIATLIMSAFLFLFNRIFDISLWSGIIEIILGILVYFGVMILIGGFGKEDLDLIKMVLWKNKS